MGLQAYKIGLVSPITSTPKPKAEAIRTPLDGFDLVPDATIETSHYYDETLDKGINDWKFIQRPVILTRDDKDEGVYLIEIKSNHCNLSNILKDSGELQRLKDEIYKIAVLSKIKHLIMSFHGCTLENGASPDPLAEFFLDIKRLMKNENRHLSLVHVEKDKLYERLKQNHEIDHFTHTIVQDAISDNGNFVNPLIPVLEDKPPQSHLKLHEVREDDHLLPSEAYLP